MAINVNGKLRVRGISVSPPPPPLNDFTLVFNVEGPMNNLLIPIGFSMSNNYTINWGDGNTDSGMNFHIYASPGTYTVSIAGTFPVFEYTFMNSIDAQKLTEIQNWGTNAFTTLKFNGCSNLTTISATDTPNVSGVTDMGNMFYNCSSLTELDASSWDISNVTSIFNMFYDCSGLTSLDVSTWDTSNVTQVGATFKNCSSLTTLDVSSWDVTGINQMSYFGQGMFQNCSSLTTLDISNWDVSNVTDMSNMFNGASPLDTTVYSNTLIYWDSLSLQSNVTFDAGTSQYNSSAASARASITSVNNWTITDGGQYVNPSEMMTMVFEIPEGPINNLLIPINYDPSNNYTINWGDGNTDSGMNFHIYASPGTYTVSIAGTFPVFEYTFMNSIDAQKLTEIQNWGTNAFTTLKFNGCSNLTTVSATDVPNLSGVTNMLSMFFGCSSLTELDASSWDVSNVTNMITMFYGCSDLTSLDVSTWNVSGVTSMNSMFYGCSSLTTLDISNWDVSNVIGMDDMFDGAAPLDTTIYSDTLNYWDTLTLQSNVTFDAGTSTYNSGASTARANIISNYTWTITDGGEV